jgi:uncharacterized protein (TIGR00299 family) protein
MKKIAYFQCPTGIAGDMCLGSLIDGGVPLGYLIDKLNSLGLQSEYHLRCEKVQRQGQMATKFQVNLTNHTLHNHRHLPEIEKLILGANLPPKPTQWSLAVFQNLAIAEGKVHGIAPEKVHFHEVGATDAIIDIVGTCLGLDYLEIDEIYCSPLPTGGGNVKVAHGILAVPVPAVLELWQTRQVPVYSNGIAQELVTPTGAAIVTTLAKEFGNPPEMELAIIGNGAGSKDLTIANILRLWIGKEKQTELFIEKIAVLATQIDDLNPQIFGYLCEQLLIAGAFDVFTQAISMKKNRPGILLTVVCPLEKVSICEDLIFQETTTLGIRKNFETRSILEREIKNIKTEYGKVRVKIARRNNQIINIQPEYEDCAALAKQHNLPWKLIHQKVIYSFWSTGLIPIRD